MLVIFPLFCCLTLAPASWPGFVIVG